MGTETWCMAAVILLLIGLLVYQQLFFTRQNQQLVDKLMSRSFGEYMNTKSPPPPRIKVSDDVPEDLRSLQEFSIM